MNNKTTAEIIKSATAVLSTIAICVSVNASVGKICDTKVNLIISNPSVSDTDLQNVESSNDNANETAENILPDKSAGDTSSDEVSPDSTAQNGATSDKTTTNSNSSKPGNSATANTSKSIADIVKIYNTSVNKVKTDAKTLTRNYKKLSSPEDQLELPSAVQSIGKWSIKTFVKGSDKAQSWTKKEDMQIIFPVGNTNYSSKMTANMVKSATCKDNGKTYQIDIVLYNDALTSPAKGKGYAGVFNTVDADSIRSANIPGVTFNQININGMNGSISCTIDKATNHITSIIFKNTDKLHIEAKAISNITAKITLISEEKFTIEY